MKKFNRRKIWKIVKIIKILIYQIIEEDAYGTNIPVVTTSSRKYRDELFEKLKDSILSNSEFKIDDTNSDCCLEVYSNINGEWEIYTTFIKIDDIVVKKGYITNRLKKHIDSFKNIEKLTSK